MRRRILSKKARAWNVEKRRILRVIDIVIDACEHLRDGEVPEARFRTNVRIQAVRHIRDLVAEDRHRVP